MREYLVRVRRQSGDYRATAREIRLCREPGTLALTGVEGVGTAANETAAIVAAVAAMRLPEHRDERRET